jgi:hypothetical protein
MSWTGKDCVSKAKRRRRTIALKVSVGGSSLTDYTYCSVDSQVRFIIGAGSSRYW